MPRKTKLHEQGSEPTDLDSKKKVKKTRPPTKYSMFVKENYSKVKDLPVKQRFRKLAEMWKQRHQ